MKELYKVHRPKTFKAVLGQDKAVQMLESLLAKEKVPHCLMFVGPSGCGKTTLARIMRDKLGCQGVDFAEINAADFRGIDLVRDLRKRQDLAPLLGTCRVWLIDEAHKLTGDAQTAFLKMLEDTPDHVYYFLATTDPGKLIKTIHTRSTVVKVEPLKPKVMQELLQKVADKEEVKISEEVLQRIVEVSEGSARKGLVVLHQILDYEDEEDQLNAILSSDHKAQAIQIAQALFNPQTRWLDMAKILKEVEGDPESIRYLVLGYASKILLGGGKLTARADLVICAFEGNFYDGKDAALYRACYQVIGSK